MQRNKKPRFGGVLFVRPYTRTSTVYGRIFELAKGKPGKTQGRKAKDPRVLRDAVCDATKDPKTAGLPTIDALSLHNQLRSGCMKQIP